MLDERADLRTQSPVWELHAALAGNIPVHTQICHVYGIEAAVLVVAYTP